MGYFKADARLWPGLVEPFVAGRVEWSDDAVRLDLAWMVDQAEAGFPFEVDGRLYRGRVPGRPALRRRWRASDRYVRALLRELGPREGEPECPASVQRMSSECPADVQRVSSGCPAAERSDLDNGPKASSARPATVQPVSSDCPADVQPMSTGASTNHQPPTTNHQPPDVGQMADGRATSATPCPDEQPSAAPPVELSTRARKALRAVGLSTVGQLAALTATELRSRPGIGPSTVAEVVELLAAHGRALRAEPPKPSRAEGAKPYREAWDAAWKAQRSGPYAWHFHRDNAQLMQIASVARTPDRARRAFDAFLRAHAGGRGVFPYDEAPTIAKFSRKVAHWVVQVEASPAERPPRRVADEWAALRSGNAEPMRDVIDAEPEPEPEKKPDIAAVFAAAFRGETR